MDNDSRGPRTSMQRQRKSRETYRLLWPSLRNAVVSFTLHSIKPEQKWTLLLHREWQSSGRECGPGILLWPFLQTSSATVYHLSQETSSLQHAKCTHSPSPRPSIYHPIIITDSGLRSQILWSRSGSGGDKSWLQFFKYVSSVTTVYV